MSEKGCKKSPFTRFGLFIKMAVIVLCGLIPACTSEDPQLCESPDFKQSKGIQVGTYPDDYHHLLTVVVHHKICIITRNGIRIYPADTTQSKFELLDLKINGAVVNAFDTIVQIENSFYRFYPGLVAFEHIFTPPFTIHDFCVTPNHGIGYFWGNVFVEPPKFNYFTFATGENKTLFETAAFIPDSPQPVYSYQTYRNKDTLFVLMITGNKDAPFGDNGVFYKVDLSRVHITGRWTYSGKSSMKIVGYNDFNVLDIAYGIRFNDLSIMAEAADFNVATGVSQNKYRFKNAWYDSKYSVKNEFLAISYHGINTTQKTELIHWKTGTKLFSIDSPEPYTSSQVEVFHNEQMPLVLSNSNVNTALVFGTNGCVSFELVSEHKIQYILAATEQTIFVLTVDHTVEAFPLK